MQDVYLTSQLSVTVCVCLLAATQLGLTLALLQLHKHLLRVLSSLDQTLQLCASLLRRTAGDNLTAETEQSQGLRSRTVGTDART